MTSVLIKGKFGHRHTGRRPCEDEGRALQAKDCQMLSANCQELGVWYTFSLTASERTQSAKTLISNSGSQNSETIVSVVSATYFVVLCYDSSSGRRQWVWSRRTTAWRDPQTLLGPGERRLAVQGPLGPRQWASQQLPLWKEDSQPPEELSCLVAPCKARMMVLPPPPFQTCLT